MELLNAWLFHLRVHTASNWYLFTLWALVSYGLYQYLLDHAISEKSETLTRSIATPALMAGACFTAVILTAMYLVYVSLQGKFVTGIALVLLLGLLQGLLFLFANIFRFEARRVFPNHTVLPITRTHVLLVILASWVLFDEFASVTPSKLVGFVLVGMAIYLFREFEAGASASEGTSGGRVETDVQDRIRGAIYLGMATLASAALALLAKYAVGPSNLDIFLFIFVSNYVTCILSGYLVWRRIRKAKPDEAGIISNPGIAKRELGHTVMYGMRLGVVNLVAFASLLHALNLSDASVVIPIYSLYVVIPVLLTAVIQGEVLTEKTTVAVVLSIAAVIILQ